MSRNEKDDYCGLMNKIQALIAPPSDSKCLDPEPPKQHSYFRRPGKGHNHDYCDSCTEGGDLICCDKCSSSFHLTCHDPPLDENDIPRGEWLCHSCKQKKDVDYPQWRFRRSTSMDGLVKATTFSGKKTKASTPMDLLIWAAKELNPKQFELPRCMSVPCVFPGTDKVESSKNGKKTNKEKKEHELTPAGLIPLPAKKCNECLKSCRVAPLIACDFCPLFYHLDCLNPPLTTPPSTRWMCPNHVEHALDEKFLNSISATERVKLWDHFTGPVDQHAIKLEFIRKVHRKNPPFRFKVKLPPRKTVKVPEMVKHHYKKPVELLPSLRDVIRVESIRHNFNIKHTRMTKSLKPVTIEEKYIEKCSESDEIKENYEALQKNAVNKTKKYSNDIGTEYIKQENIFSEDFLAGFNTEVELELKQLDDRLIKILAFQRIKQLLTENSNQNLNQALFSQNLQNQILQMPLPSELVTPADMQKISRVFSGMKEKKVSSLRARAILCPVVSKHFYNVKTDDVDPKDLRHDDSFMGYRPTVSNRFPEAVGMRYRVLNIGRGSGNDVTLERFGCCNSLSEKHAVIFYDECTKCYGLINYSQYGTYVNNIFYSNDISRKNPDPEVSEDPKLAKVEGAVRDIISKKRRSKGTKSAPKKSNDNTPSNTG